MNPVRITGIGVISAAGDDAGATLESFRSGTRNPRFGFPFDTTIKATAFQVSGELPELSGRFNASRTLRLAMRAVREALASAQLENFRDDVRVGVCLGTTVACQLNSIPFYAAYRQWIAARGIADPVASTSDCSNESTSIREAASGEFPSLDPILNFLSANLATAVQRILNVSGPRMTIVNACSSGTDAIGTAASWIRAGLCDVAIAGGADEVNRVPVAGFWSLGVMSTEPCKPFDRDRAGLNLGEGAGVVILESDAHAKERGATARFAVAGFGAACDAHHLTAPHPEGRGLQSAIDAALAQAGATPEDVAFINAHGTATQDNDRAESTVIARTFGTRVPFLSTKGYTGHTLGAAGGVEAVFTLLGLREGWIPRSAGFDNAPDDMPVAPVREKTSIKGRFALSTSLAFGGNNAALVLGRAE